MARGTVLLPHKLSRHQAWNRCLTLFDCFNVGIRILVTHNLLDEQWAFPADKPKDLNSYPLESLRSLLHPKLFWDIFFSFAFSIEHPAVIVVLFNGVDPAFVTKSYCCHWHVLLKNVLAEGHSFFVGFIRHLQGGWGIHRANFLLRKPSLDGRFAHLIMVYIAVNDAS